MITVEKTIEANKNSAKIASEQNDEQLKTGTVKAKKQSYWPWVLLGVGAIIAGYLWYKRSKKDNGAISG